MLSLAHFPHNEGGGRPCVEGFGVGLHGDVHASVAGGDNRFGKTMSLIANDENVKQKAKNKDNTYFIALILIVNEFVKIYKIRSSQPSVSVKKLLHFF